MRRRALIAILSAGLLAASCGTRGGGPGTPAPGSLDGRSFLSTAVLEGGVERPLVPGTRVEIQFADGRLSARAGCNTMSAPYETDGDVLRLVGPAAMTEIGCDPPLAEQDAWLLGVLGSSPRIELDGPELSLVDGETVLRLLDREVAEPDRPLVGTTWRLETVIDGDTASSVPSGLRAWLRLPDERTVDVFTGCNEGSGRVSLGEGALTIRSLVLTQIGCGGPAGALERDVLAMLTAPRIEFRVEGSVLSLRAGGRGLDWRA